MKKVLLFALMGLVMTGSFTSCKKDKQEKELLLSDKLLTFHYRK